MPSKYHHGELRSALVTTSLELIAEQGLKGFSVAEVARRAGVSPAAPYRHFPDRESLLAAVACRVATQLTERVEAATAEHEDAADKLAAVAGAYTAYMIDRRAGLHVVFAAGLDNPKYTELHERTRKLMDHFLMLSIAVAPDLETALAMMEQLLAQAHGYGAFQLDGVLAQHGYSTELVVRKSTESARIVIRGYLDPARG